MPVDTILLILLNVIIGSLAGISLFILQRVFNKLDHIERALTLFGERVARMEERQKLHPKACGSD